VAWRVSWTQSAWQELGTRNGTLNNAQVARITSAADPRHVQMGMKLVF
jgi:hypothetical protein